MLFQLKLFSIKSDVIRTTYDKSTLPYLLMYIMGKYDEKFGDQALEPSQLASILLEKYPADFFQSSSKSSIVIVFDCYDIWEKYCGIWNIIKTVKMFDIL